MNSDKYIKRKEMKNNYSPLDNEYTFCRLLYTRVSNAFVTKNPNSTK